MAKRTADTDLTHDNWDQEQEEEEAGVFRSAPREVLEKREIKKAKRRVATDGRDGTGAFKGLKFDVPITTAGNLPISFTMQPNSTTSGPTSRFGGHAVASVAISNFTSAAAFAPLGVAVSVSKGGSSSKSQSGELDTESQYRSSVRTLNESVLSWINDHIKTNPYCILTPVFSDYEKYIKELDDEFPQSSDKVVDKAPVAISAATGFPFSTFGAITTVPSSVVSHSLTSTSVAGGLISSCTTAANLERKPYVPTPSTTASMTAFAAPGFLFRAQDSNVSAGFGCPSVGSTSSGFNLGAQPCKGATYPTSGASFAAGSSNLPATSTSVAFGDDSSKISGFSFGAQLSKGPAANPISGFGFGAKPSQETSTSGFSFGNMSTKEASNSPVAGQSGAQPSKDAFAAPATDFRLAIKSANESTSSSEPAGTSTAAPNQGGEDDNYIPPKNEVVEIKEEGAFYTIRCKLYCKIDDKFNERGIGHLYLKPCGDKTQLLVRAETTLGNILLNIMLNKSIPTSRKANSVTMVCVPNPPLDVKKPDDRTPFCMLFRVKTEEDAETLLKQINDHK